MSLFITLLATFITKCVTQQTNWNYFTEGSPLLPNVMDSFITGWDYETNKLFLFGGYYYVAQTGYPNYAVYSLDLTSPSTWNNVVTSSQRISQQGSSSFVIDRTVYFINDIIDYISTFNMDSNTFNHYYLNASVEVNPPSLKNRIICTDYQSPFTIFMTYLDDYDSQYKMTYYKQVNGYWKLAQNLANDHRFGWCHWYNDEFYVGGNGFGVGYNNIEWVSTDLNIQTNSWNIYYYDALTIESSGIDRNGGFIYLEENRTPSTDLYIFNTISKQLTSNRSVNILAFETHDPIFATMDGIFYLFGGSMDSSLSRRWQYSNRITQSPTNMQSNPSLPPSYIPSQIPSSIPSKIPSNPSPTGPTHQPTEIPTEHAQTANAKYIELSFHILYVCFILIVVIY